MSVIWPELGRSWHCCSPETSLLWTKVAGVLQEAELESVPVRGIFFVENFTGGGTLLSPLIKLNKNSVNMELDLRSEVNTIHNSYHVTQLCLLIGRTDDWGNHSELGLVDLINNSLHLFNFLSLFSTLKCGCSCWCWYVNQSIPLVSIFPIQFLSFNS